MKRNKNVDIIRAIAILLVVVFHIYATTDIKFNIPILDTFLVYGGIIGVSTFFILSGYGIYCSLRNQENKKEKFSYRDYMIKRIKRIAPQYYFSLIILLFFTGGAIYLAKDQIYNLVSHLFFFHSNYYRASGAISGVCWTIGVIFQFYLIAPLLYRAIQKRPKLTLLISIILSIGIKFFLYHYVFNISNAEPSYYFNYGRQIYTAIDHFILGMFVAKLSFDRKSMKLPTIVTIIISSILIAGTYILLKVGTIQNLPFKNTGINSDCIYGYIGYTALAIIISLLIHLISKLEFKLTSLPSKFLLFISKYKYGIYIWHLIIIENLTMSSPIMKNLVTYNYKIPVYIILTSLSIVFGYIMTKIIDEIDYQSWFESIKKNILIIIKIGIIFLAALCVYKTARTIKPIIKNFQTYYNDEAVDKNDSKKIAEHFDSLIKDKEGKKYIYIDSEEKGYLYFFQLRYYLSPCESIHYSDYAYIINYTSLEDIYRYLKESDLDYAIIRENSLLTEELSIDFDPEYGSIYKINKESTSIQDILIEVEVEQ